MTSPTAPALRLVGTYDEADAAFVEKSDCTTDVEPVNKAETENKSGEIKTDQSDAHVGVAQQFDRKALLSRVPARTEIDCITTLRENSPARPLDWCWQKAARQFYDKKTPHWRHGDNQEIADAHKLISVLNRCRSEDHLSRVCDAEPAWWHAYKLAKDRQEHGDHAAFEIEARILARESFADIAGSMAMTVETVQQYERWFFHVTDRLDKTGWVVSKVIGKQFHTGLSESDPGPLWKTYGYFGGRHVLAELIHGFEPQQPSGQPLDAEAFFRQDIITVLRRRAAIAIRTINLDDPTTALRFARSFMRYEAFKSRRKNTVGENTMNQRHYEAAAEAIRKSVSTSVPGAPENFERQYQDWIRRLTPDVTACAASERHGAAYPETQDGDWRLNDDVVF